MSSNSCKRLLIQIFSKLMVGACGVFWVFDAAVAWDVRGEIYTKSPNCRLQDYGVDCDFSGIYSGDPYSTSDGHCCVYRINKGATYDNNFTETGGVYQNCRIAAAGLQSSGGCGFDWPLADKCGSAGKHVERACCQDDASCFTKDNYDTRNCNSGFYFGPVIYDGNTVVADLVSGGRASKGLHADVASTYLIHGITFDRSMLKEPTSDDSQFKYLNDDKARGYKWSLPKNGNVVTFGFKQQTSSNYVAYRCVSGVVNWAAEEDAGGDAAYGFYVKFDKSKAIYTCSECMKGWTFKTYTNDSVTCETCNTRGHWDCLSDGTARCFSGYQQNGDGSSAICTTKPHYECPIELNTNQNTCVCKFGFTGDDCNECRENFQLVEDTSNHENDRCLCPDGYIKYGENTTDNPNDDRCVLDADQVYVDQTGWFTLSSENMCNGNWWEQENNN